MVHIQNFSDAASLEPHWGYADRVIPCTNDAGSCAYLDVVYHSHDLGMLYSGIFWATVMGVIFLWAMARRMFPSQRASEQLISTSTEKSTPPQSAIHRFTRTIAAHSRRYLLPDCARWIFGRTSRTQVLILVVLTGYLTVWSFVGIVYAKWVTPVKKMPGVYNTRTSLGPFSDRIGILAYALTPLSILLSSRESLLSLITGVPYQHFNFLHRWLGYIIFAQSFIHTLGWTLIETWLYQPQPSVGVDWIKQLYMIWGCVAMILLLLLVILSTPWAIRLTGYEFFRKSHYILAMVYIGACIGHWKQLECFLIPAIIVWFLDRAARLVRTAVLHYNSTPDGTMEFGAAKGAITHFPDSVNGDVVRLDFHHPHDPWKIGQHFYLCFPESSLWQSHPFTPLSLPVEDPKAGGVLHSYIFRAKGGETKKIAQIAAAKTAAGPLASTSVVLTGPYGETITSHLTQEVNILCVAGGTGITYVLPVLLNLAQQPRSLDRRVTLVWAVRQKSDLAWVKPELDRVRMLAKSIELTIRIFVTREASSKLISPADSEKGVELDFKNGVTTTSAPAASSSSNASDSIVEASACCGPPVDSFTVQKTAIPAANPEEAPEHQHPDLHVIVKDFVESTIRGRSIVYASGPGGMISDLREIVASCNDGSRVWRNEEKFDVQLICDDRLEW